VRFGTNAKCHCRDCQQLSGGPFVPFLIVPAEAFRLTRGKLQYHFTESLKGSKHKRLFCANWFTPNRGRVGYFLVDCRACRRQLG
jgi:hypothetical protein